MRKLSRKRDQRKALLRSLAENLFLKEKIVTSEAKAKELRRFSERLIEKAKAGDLASKRYLAKFFKRNLVKKISEISQRYKERKGGYTRILKLGPRKSDGAKMAQIELIK
jgi:large subunit ribosomal protein L17